jgi:hypothetical protein
MNISFFIHNSCSPKDVENFFKIARSFAGIKKGGIVAHVRLRENKATL